MRNDTVSLAPGTGGAFDGRSAGLVVAALNAFSAMLRASGGMGPRAIRQTVRGPGSAPFPLRSRGRALARWYAARPATCAQPATLHQPHVRRLRHSPVTAC